MNPNKRQSAAIGIFLIGLGVMMWLSLWWLLWPGALAVAGVLGYRERRRQHRTGLLKGITQMLGTSLDLRQILEPVGDTVRVAIEFDAMGVVLFKPGGREYEF